MNIIFNQLLFFTKCNFSLEALQKYQLPSDGFVTLRVYDILGREITTLVNEYKQAGSYNVEFNAAELSSGIYFYKITANGKTGKYTAINKMQLLK